MRHRVCHSACAMVIELITRFIMGGVIVSAFASIANVLRPQTFAGIFGAAPSVALATLGLTFAAKGPAYAGTEGKAMMAGAIAFIVYSIAVGIVIMRERTSSLVAASSGWLLWGAIAFGAWGLWLR